VIHLSLVCGIDAVWEYWACLENRKNSYHQFWYFSSNVY